MKLLLAVLLAAAAGVRGEDFWAEDIRPQAALPTHVFDWSPDGRLLAFADAEGIQIARLPDVTRPVRLALEGWDRDPGYSIDQIRWSPDSRRIAFISARKRDQWKTIWLTGADGRQVRELLPPEVDRQFGSPGVRAVAIGAWINNYEIAFHQHCGPGCASLHRVDVDNLRYGHYCIAMVDFGMHWAPSRDRMIFGGHGGSLGVVDLRKTGEGECPASMHGYQFEDWARDGRALVRGQDGRLMAWTPGGKMEPAPSGALLGAWSPDGLLVAAQDKAKNLVVMRPDGSGRRILVKNASARVSWSPDSRWLIVQATRENLAVEVAPAYVVKLP